MNKAAEDIIRQIYEKKLKHGPNQSGWQGPCDSDCEKCHLEAELKKLLNNEL